MSGFNLGSHNFGNIYGYFFSVSGHYFYGIARIGGVTELESARGRNLCVITAKTRTSCPGSTARGTTAGLIRAFLGINCHDANRSRIGCPR